MNSSTTVRQVVLTVIGVLVAGALTAGAMGVKTAEVKPDIQVQISPANQSVARGETATFTVTLTSGGFAGAVGLSASGLPSGSTYSLVPSTPTLAASRAGSTVTSVLSVTTTAGTPVGPFNLRVTGTSGQVSGSGTAELTVEYPLAGYLSMSAAPAAVTLAAGSSAAYAVQIARTNLSGNVTFSVSGALPSGMTATFSPSSTNGASSTLRVATTAAIPVGSFTLHLVASGNDANKERRIAYASVQLVIKSTGKSFNISGSLNNLPVPTRALPLALSLTNPNRKSLSVTNLSVILQGLSLNYAISHGRPCTLSDYAVIQFGGGYPLVMPGSSTMTLTQLGVASRQWPQIQFVGTPEDQDGCKGATLSLSYSGSGHPS